MRNQTESKIRLVGEICVDVILNNPAGPLIRLGGVMHAARALGALGVKYDIFYIAPTYLQNQIQELSHRFKAQEVVCLGEVEGSPNVLLISDQRETAAQGYELILRDHYRCTYVDSVLTSLGSDNSASDVILYSYGSDLSAITSSLASSQSTIHIDLGQSFSDYSQISGIVENIETLMVSTSFDDFHTSHNGVVSSLCEQLQGFCKDILFKENRGGARLFRSSHPSTPLQVGAQIRPVNHSVGVGDCYDAIYIALSKKHSPLVALSYASWISAEYACYKDWDSFVRECAAIMRIPSKDITQLEGIKLSWEDRGSFNIYIAGPDFDYLDTTHIESVAGCLSYHNFKPRLPIQENGQASITDSSATRKRMYQADMRLLEQCHMLLAVIINEDVGTMIELGLASGMGLPVVVYDPYGMAGNLILQQLPDLLSSDLDEILIRVFEIASRGN